MQYNVKVTLKVGKLPYSYTFKSLPVLLSWLNEYYINIENKDFQIITIYKKGDKR